MKELNYVITNDKTEIKKLKGEDYFEISRKPEIEKIVVMRGVSYVISNIETVEENFYRLTLVSVDANSRRKLCVYHFEDKFMYECSIYVKKNLLTGFEYKDYSCLRIEQKLTTNLLTAYTNYIYSPICFGYTKNTKDCVVEYLKNEKTGETNGIVCKSKDFIIKVVKLSDIWLEV